MTNPQRIIRPPTAFTLSSGRQKRPRRRDEEHLAFIRRLSCLVTGRKDFIEAAHVRYGDPRYGKRETGLQEKPDDRFTVPLQRDQHKDQHRHDERTWWQAKGIDPVAIASALWGVSGDDEAAEVILRNARTPLAER